MKVIFQVVFVLFSGACFSQNLNWSVLSIPDSLKANANTVIRNSELTIEIKSKNNYVVTEKRVVTVLNELGLQQLDVSEYYDKSTSVKDIEAIVYDAFGKIIKKIKRKEFKDNSISEGSVVTDGRLLYLDYTPSQYPFTIEFSSVVESSNTAFLPKWIPVSKFYTSIQFSSLQLINNSGVQLRHKEKNFDNSVVHFPYLSICINRHVQNDGPI